MGAIFATIGMVLPSFVIIFLISKYLDRFLEISWISNAFHGIKIAVGILILDAAVKMLSKAKLTALKITIIIASCIAMLVINFFSLHISSLVIMLFAALVGLVSFLIKNKTERGEAD